MSDTSKPWWQSTTILGALAVVIAMAVRVFVPDLEDKEVLDVLTLVSQLVGAIVAIVGRVRASKVIQKRLT